MRICPRCETLNEDNDKICYVCGHATALYQPYEKTVRRPDVMQRTENVSVNIPADMPANIPVNIPVNTSVNIPAGYWDGRNMPLRFGELDRFGEGGADYYGSGGMKWWKKLLIAVAVIAAAALIVAGIVLYNKLSLGS